MKHDTIVPIDGLDFSGDSRGKFKGLVSLTYRMVNNEATGAQDPLGGGGSDWVLADSLGLEYYLGAGNEVTESSGIFSFASTGYWLIFGVFIAVSSSVDDYARIELYTTEDGGSTWNTVTYATCSFARATNYMPFVLPITCVKITDVNNQKIKFYQRFDDYSYVTGSLIVNTTSVSFTKLADL